MKKIYDGIYLKDSLEKGNTTTIMVGVHGNEKTGVNVLNKIIDKIKINNGKIYFIFANLKAIEKNVRFVEKNLNRCFVKSNNENTYEDIRAKEIMKILDKSDYLLDIHNTINEENSVPFLISEYKEFGEYFDVDYVVSGFDKLHFGGSDAYMNSIGKKGFCLECGSINIGNSNELEYLAEKSIINFLKITKNLKGNIQVYNNNQKYIKFDFIYKNKSLDFKFIKKFKDFEFISKGDLIAYDNNKKIIANKDCYILFPYMPGKLKDECFCLGKKE